MKNINFDLNGKEWIVEGQSDSICVNPATWDNPSEYEWVWLSHPNIIGVIDEEGLNYCTVSEEAEALEYCYQNVHLFEI